MRSKSLPKLDEKDYHILKILALDSMVSLKDISEQVGLSPPPVSVRIKRLRNKGVLEPCVHIFFERFGLGRYSLGLTLRTGIPADSRDRVIERFINEPAVISIWITSGEHDLMVDAVFASSYELLNFIDKKIRTITEISSIDVCEMLEAVKRDCKNMRTNHIDEIPVPFSPKKKRRGPK